MLINKLQSGVLGKLRSKLSGVARAVKRVIRYITELDHIVRAHYASPNFAETGNSDYLIRFKLRLTDNSQLTPMVFARSDSVTDCMFIRNSGRIYVRDSAGTFIETASDIYEFDGAEKEITVATDTNGDTEVRYQGNVVGTGRLGNIRYDQLGLRLADSGPLKGAYTLHELYKQGARAVHTKFDGNYSVANKVVGNDDAALVDFDFTNDWTLQNTTALNTIELSDNKRTLTITKRETGSVRARIYTIDPTKKYKLSGRVSVTNVIARISTHAPNWTDTILNFSMTSDGEFSQVFENSFVIALTISSGSGTAVFENLKLEEIPDDTPFFEAENIADGDSEKYTDNKTDSQLESVDVEPQEIIPYTADSTLPVISNVEVTPRVEDATISWSTDKPTICTLTVPNKGSVVSGPALEHSVTVYGLDAGQVYNSTINAKGFNNKTASQAVVIGTADRFLTLFNASIVAHLESRTFFSMGDNDYFLEINIALLSDDTELRTIYGRSASSTSRFFINNTGALVFRDKNNALLLSSSGIFARDGSFKSVRLVNSSEGIATVYYEGSQVATGNFGGFDIELIGLRQGVNPFNGYLKDFKAIANGQTVVSSPIDEDLSPQRTFVDNLAVVKGPNLVGTETIELSGSGAVAEQDAEGIYTIVRTSSGSGGQVLINTPTDDAAVEIKLEITEGNTLRVRDGWGVNQYINLGVGIVHVRLQLTGDNPIRIGSNVTNATVKFKLLEIRELPTDAIFFEAQNVAQGDSMPVIDNASSNQFESTDREPQIIIPYTPET